MKTQNIFSLIQVGLAVISFSSTSYAYPRAGHQAQFSTLFHDVSGTATIIDSNTIQIDNFTYDGLGPAVYFYLGQTNTQADFVSGKTIGPLLSGTVYTNDTLTIDVPGVNPLDGYNAISVWCVDFDANFGSGTFGSVVQYEVIFDATWSEETHTNVPLDPHFSNLIGSTHSGDFTMWQLAQLSSPGMKDMDDQSASV